MLEIWKIWIETESPTTELLFARGTGMIQAGDLDLALQLLDTVVLLNPGYYAPLLGNPPDPAALSQYLQPDGLHPTAEGVTRIVEGLGPDVLRLMEEMK